jgi:ABC-type amino acid transport substrate-binding protein
MLRIGVVLLVTLSLLAQEITVYVNSAENKFNLFERAVVENLIKIHNERTKSTYTIKLHPYSEFKRLFIVLGNAKQTERILGINSISITDLRSESFSFSQAYISTNLVVLSKKHTTFSCDETMTIAYTDNSIQFDIIKELKRDYPFKMVGYSDFNLKYKALLSGEDDYALGDYIDRWIYDLNVVHEIENYGKDSYGLMFTKESTLFHELKDTMAYYFSSADYFALVDKHLGSEAVLYIKKNIAQNN